MLDSDQSFSPCVSLTTCNVQGVVMTKESSDLERIYMLASFYYEARASFELKHELTKALHSPRFERAELAIHSEEVHECFRQSLKRCVNELAPRDTHELNLLIAAEQLLLRRESQALIPGLASAIIHLDIYIFDVTFEIIESFVKGSALEDSWNESTSNISPARSANVIRGFIPDTEAAKANHNTSRKDEQEMRITAPGEGAFKGIFLFTLTLFFAMMARTFDGVIECHNRSQSLASCFEFKFTLAILAILFAALIYSAFLAGYLRASKRLLASLRESK